ncbi:hypothetical protein [Actinomadura opuntiae]|uniref:hypothetical protein n=1 Tax=Actinomadura sp. OS1-43 TaxID=604315 RepID=UPI00255B0596|nr:hypothetical protein [Actinomadura sp. OS1-43]MDL4816183.1 hypothetical protein [Actinomadura sp. OS1-43]
MLAAANWYRDGLGGPADRVQAVRWFIAMLTMGDGNGVHHAVQLAKTMTDEEIREAARLARKPEAGDALIATVRGGGSGGGCCFSVAGSCCCVGGWSLFIG